MYEQNERGNPKEISIVSKSHSISNQYPIVPKGKRSQIFELGKYNDLESRL